LPVAEYEPRGYHNDAARGLNRRVRRVVVVTPYFIVGGPDFQVVLLHQGQVRFAGALDALAARAEGRVWRRLPAVTALRLPACVEVRLSLP